MYYFYGKSNRGHEICPLYRGCPPLGESVIRGFTVMRHYGAKPSAQLPKRTKNLQGDIKHAVMKPETSTQA